MKKFVWLSFDLGLRGDYEGMYEFLDGQNARECGDSVAAFNFEFRRNLTKELRSAVEKSVEINKRTRVYVIYPGPNEKPIGKFIIGNRKSPPWTGFGPSSLFDEEDFGE